MSTAWPQESLGQLLGPVERAERVDPSRLYRLLGARWYAQGLFVKDEKTGHQIKANTLYRVQSGDFVYNRLFAWKGSFAIADSNADGCHVSNEFPCFAVNSERLDPSYLKWWFSRENSWLEALGLSNGATPTSRNRLKEERLLGMEIPLPPLAEQRRIVTRIEELAAKLREVYRLRTQASMEIRTFQLHVARDSFPEPTGGAVSDWVKFQTGYAFKSEWFTDSGVRLARNANVGHGTLDWSETVRIPEARRGEFQRFELEEGDILITLDRPIISTGIKVARVRKEDLPCLLLQRVARAQFQSDTILPEYFFQWLQSPHFVNAIDPGRSNGVPHISHKDIEKIPFAVPPVPEQRRIVVELDALREKVDLVKTLQSETAAELDAMLPAILDKAFKGEL